MRKIDFDEFCNIINPYVQNQEFRLLKNCKHHGIDRYSHSLRVAYYTYCVTKKISRRYVDATVAALLHDFFIDEVRLENALDRLLLHPIIAAQNSKRLFDINDFQENIIVRHMFPITPIPPKTWEGWIVDFLDDVASVYEKSQCWKNELSAALTFLFLMFVHFISY